jgi:tetraacyldisaccharide 4'-kinase
MLLLRKILWPFSLLYGLGVYFRNLTYDLGWRTFNSFQTPTICVGNLSLGGTGKTPMIEWLLRELGQYDHIGVLSRGYKRKTSGFVVAEQESTAADIGDEPLQIHIKFPSVVVAVDGNRSRGIKNLEDRHHPDLILLDDAFQHRKVKADFYILLTTFEQPYFTDHYIPAGTLRDSISQAKRADLIIVTKCPADLSESTMESYREKLDQNGKKEVLFCSLDYSNRLIGTKSELAIDEIANRRLKVVTGIATPEPLLNYLSGRGLAITHMSFRDHHQFSATELDSLRDEEIIITTEKDFVRGLKVLDQVYYVEVRHRFLSDGKQRLLNALNELKR